MSRTLYFGGPVLTMDRARPRAEAVLTEDGRILAVGSLEELRPLAGGSSSVDLDGRVLMPGFVDGHGHLASTGAYYNRCDLSGCTSMEQIRQRILRFRQDRDLLHGEPIICQRYDNNLLPGGAHPTAAELDQMEIDNPVFCGHISGHMAGVNTAAMRFCGVDDSYAPPAGSDGVAQRDEQGHLTGYFSESAQRPFTSRLCVETDEQFEKGILLAQEEYIARGFTTIQDGSGFDEGRVACYERLAKAGKLKVDVVIYLSATPAQPDMWEKTLARLGNREYHGRLKIGGIKIVLDGSPQARTAWLSQPYEGEAEYRGLPSMSDEKLRDILTKAVKAGLQPLAHCNGDAASEQFLRVWEQVIAQEHHGAELRPVMIHCQTVRFDQLDRMVKCGMLPSIFVGHCWHWGDVHMRNLGQRAQRISPVKAALDRGLVYNFHQDSPVTAPDMLFSAWCAVNRVTSGGVCIGPDQRVSAYDALMGTTYGGAYAHFEEESKGVLKPGAREDLVVLDRDPTAVDPMEIKNVQICRTIKDGVTVYQAK